MQTLQGLDSKLIKVPHYRPFVGDHGVGPVHVLVDQGFVLLRQKVLGDPPRGFFLRENVLVYIDLGSLYWAILEID